MDTQQIISERMKVLPEDIRAAIKSADLSSKFDIVANSHNLHVDQNSSLQTETILVMLGLESTDDYVENIERELEITHSEAISIAKDINSQIFDSIRSSLQKIQHEQMEETKNEQRAANDDLSKITPNTPESVPQQPTKTVETPKPTPAFTITRPVTVEQAGQFTIEKEKTETNQYNSSNIERDKLLKSIENPEEIRPDHILEKHTQANIESNPKPQPPAPTPSKPIIDKKYTSDPYREPI